MKLLAPAGSLESAKTVIEAGANEIYIGAWPANLNNYSFSGRSVRSNSGRRIQAYYSELGDIVNFAHENNVLVNFLANIPFMNNDDSGLTHKSITELFDEYIDAGISAGVDSLIVGDLGVIYKLKSQKYKIPIIASSYLDTLNSFAIRFLEGLGIQQVILSYQISLCEIKKIAEKTSLRLEVFGHGKCSFHAGSCNLFHDGGEGGEDGIELGYPCRGMYTVSQNGIKICRNRFLDNFKFCSLCQIKDLIDSNIHALKIVGREVDLGFMSKVVETYRTAIDLVSEGRNIAYERDKFLPLWWKKMWCQTGKRCMYANDGENICQ